MRTVFRTFALLAFLACAPASHAAGYPDHPVKVIVPFPAGGVTDLATRIIAQKLTERLGQQFFIENVGGAGGNIGMAEAAHAKGDGYTVLFASSSIVVNPSLYARIPFDVEKDFVPVTKAGASPNSWLVNPEFPAKTMNELLDLMRANPGRYSVASPGTGTTPSLSIEMLKQGLGVSFVTVPFAGGGPMIQSVLGGFTPIACGAIGNSVPLIKQGKIRALAITVTRRLETLPDVPTFDELGIKGQEAETMTGVFVPAGTPQKEIAGIVKQPDIHQRLLDFGVVPDGDSSAEFAAYVKAELAKWKRVIEVGKIDKI
jgi:tripartite-type tricarboxylate transporter receptor subunit TctC